MPQRNLGSSEQRRCSILSRTKLLSHAASTPVRWLKSVPWHFVEADAFQIKNGSISKISWTHFLELESISVHHASSKSKGLRNYWEVHGAFIPGLFKSLKSLNRGFQFLYHFSNRSSYLQPNRIQIQIIDVTVFISLHCYVVSCIKNSRLANYLGWHQCLEIGKQFGKWNCWSVVNYDKRSCILPVFCKPRIRKPQKNRRVM